MNRFLAFMDSERANKAYARGVQEGLDGGLMEDLSHSFKDIIPIPSKYEDVYDAGYLWGARHRHTVESDSKRERRLGKEEEERERQRSENRAPEIAVKQPVKTRHDSDYWDDDDDYLDYAQTASQQHAAPDTLSPSPEDDGFDQSNSQIMQQD